MNAFLTRGRRGTFLTHKPPIIYPIDVIGHLDVYPRHGELLDVRHLCEDGVQLLIRTHSTGLVLPSLVPVRGRLVWETIDTHLLVPFVA